MDSNSKIITYMLITIAVIVYEVYCTNSTFNGHNYTNGIAQYPSQNQFWPPLNSNPLVWNYQSNYTNPRSNVWFDVNSRQPNRRRNNYTSNFPVHSNIGNDSKKPVYNRTESKVEVDDNELRSFSEDLFQRDTNNAYKYITVNYQGKTTSSSPQDLAPEPLLQVSTNVNGIPTINKLKRLYDNYITSTDQAEVVTNQEKEEEDDLLNEFLNTNVMDFTKNFLVSKGVISNDPNEFKNILKEIWFTLYPRKKGTLGSSGFEHIFLAEIKNNDVSGFHNWVYFNDQELVNNADYLGYLKIVDLGNKAAILKHHFKFHGIDKPVDSLFIGTSPELEMALYSTCFLIRRDRVCPLQLAGKRFIVRAFSFDYNGKKLIGSAFPEI